METISKELVGLAAAGVAWAAGWVWAKIRSDRRAKISQIEQWARQAFDALEGLAQRHQSTGTKPTGAEKEARAMALLEALARGAGVKLRDSDRAFARTLWHALADAKESDAARFADALKRLTTRALPPQLAPSAER